MPLEDVQEWFAELDSERFNDRIGPEVAPSAERVVSWLFRVRAGRYPMLQAVTVRPDGELTVEYRRELLTHDARVQPRTRRHHHALGAHQWMSACQHEIWASDPPVPPADQLAGIGARAEHGGVSTDQPIRAHGDHARRTTALPHEAVEEARPGAVLDLQVDPERS